MRKQTVFIVGGEEVSTLREAADEYIAVLAEGSPEVDLVTVRTETNEFIKWLDHQSPATSLLGRIS